MKSFFSPKIFVVAAVFSWDPSSFGGEPNVMTAGPTQIHVRHEAQIAASNVELGAIADITSTNIDDRAMSSLILGESPQTGKAVEWTAAEISKRLHPYSRILRGAQIKLPDHITIRRAVSGFTRENLKAQIEDSLKATLPDSSWEAHVTELNVPGGTIEVPRDGSVQVVPQMVRPRGATNFEVLVVADGQVVKRLWVPCRMNYFARVPTITRQIDAHSRVTESDLKWDRRDVTYSMDVPASTADLSNAVARVTLTPGTILNRSQLEREMALKFGQEVELAAGSEDFSVSTKGIAQQNGFVGDTVKVKNIATNKIIDGVVTGPGVVQVKF